MTHSPAMAVGATFPQAPVRRKLRDAARDLDRFAGFGAVTVLLFVFLYLPIVILVVYSFNASATISVWEGFTLDWYWTAIRNTDLHRAALNTLLIGGVATVASVLLAIPAALTLSGPAQSGGSVKYLLVLSLPLMLPEIMIAIATLILFTTIGLNLGIGNVMIAHTVFCLPFALMPILAREGLDPWPVGVDVTPGHAACWCSTANPQADLIAGALRPRRRTPGAKKD